MNFVFMAALSLSLLYFSSESEYHAKMTLIGPLDRTDRALIQALQNNARISNKALAQHVGLAPSTCLERVRNLRTRGVIRGYHADVEPAALGHGAQALIAVRIRPHSRPIVDEFWEHVLELPEVI